MEGSLTIFAALQSARASLGGGHDGSDGAAVETPRLPPRSLSGGSGVSAGEVFQAEDAASSDEAPPRLYVARNPGDVMLVDPDESHTPALPAQPIQPTLDRAGLGAPAAIAGASVTAAALLAHVTGLTRTQILARPETPLTAEQSAAFAGLVARAAQGEPLAYLTGQREFYGLEFDVDPGVLVPRPETERLVDLALAARPRCVLDVGTGSGCLAVALAVHLPQAAIVATDLSPQALAVARRNAERHRVADRIHFIQSDLLDFWLLPTSDVQLPASTVHAPTGRSPTSQFDLLVANLPYIDQAELPRLPVARFEPRLALDGGPGGLALVERLLAQAPAVLAPEGRLLLEIGADQGPAAMRLARAAFPGSDARVERDLAGLDRVLAIGPRPEHPQHGR